MNEFKRKIKAYKSSFSNAIEQPLEEKTLQSLRNRYLGRKKGYLTLLFDDIKDINTADKPEAGRLLNELKQFIQVKLDIEKNRLQNPQSQTGPMDLTLPGRKRYWGTPHPVVQFKLKIEHILLHMGFALEEGPEIETDFYNFEVLNFPRNHPSRDEWDTLYLNEDLLLRTHVSPVLIRGIQKKRPPLWIFNSGKVFRKETPDQVHLPVFFQVGGLVLDHGMTFAHLKGTLECFLKALFSDNVKIRFRPGFLPYTEPSAEIDITCSACSGKDPDCRICRGFGWIAMMRAGMVDPHVLKSVNIDPEKYSGFIFGLEVDRAAGAAFQIPDLRFFYENDLRFLRQFVRS